jgi:hypothetical protein
MSSALKGYILKILSPSKVVINLGRQQGITKGMKFVIYDEGDMIIDPKTGKPIEKLELVKGEVEVIHVQENMSTAESYTIEKRTAYTPLAMMSPYAAKEEVKVTKELTKEKVKEISPSPVKVGDIVRRIY